jgi:hypothetical protein
LCCWKAKDVPSDCAAKQEQRNTTAGKRANGFSCAPNPNSRANSFSCTLNPSPNSLKALPFEGLIYRYPEVINCPDPATSDTRLLAFCFSNFTTLPVDKEINKKVIIV